MFDGEPTQEAILLHETLPEGGCVIVFWNIYIDESGDDGADMFAVGGYLIESRRAMLMRSHWRKLLAEHDLPYFHMVEAAHHSDEHPSELFEGMTAKEVDALARNLMDLIKKYARCGVVGLVNPRRAPGVKDYYTFLLHYLLSRFRGMAHQLDTTPDRFDPPLSIFVESGHNSETIAQDELSRGVREHAGPNPPAVIFANKRQITLLQAADIISWQATKRHKDIISGRRGPRKDYLELMKVHQEYIYYSVDQAGVQNHFHDNDASNRSTPPERQRVREDYVRALFSFGEDADKIIDEFHRMHWDAQHGGPFPPDSTLWEGDTDFA